MIRQSFIWVNLTYCVGGSSHIFASLANTLNHVVAEEAHGEVVVRSSQASEDWNTSDSEENVFKNFSSFHICNYL